MVRIPAASLRTRLLDFAPAAVHMTHCGNCLGAVRGGGEIVCVRERQYSDGSTAHFCALVEQVSQSQQARAERAGRSQMEKTLRSAQ